VPDISLTDFVDFTITLPPSQLTKVRQLAKRGSYDPRFDFWKALREEIRNAHQRRAKLDDVLLSLTDPKKVKRYPMAIRAYKKFIAKQGTIKWFAPPSAIWTYEGLNVKVNPELGLEFGGKKYVVKLYFKEDKPTKHRLKVVFEMMRVALHCGDAVPAVVDVTNGRLITPKPLDEDLLPLLQAQALAFMHLWKALSANAQSTKA
jgi:hypothetical protein